MHCDGLIYNSCFFGCYHKHSLFYDSNSVIITVLELLIIPLNIKPLEILKNVYSRVAIEF